MSFSQLFNFLKRFENLRTHDSVIEKVAMDWCVSRVKLLPEDLEVRRKGQNLVIAIKSMPAKNAVFMVQSRLLEELERKFGPRAPKKILFK